MSESIGEMILPGTYIDVRAEGLIGVSGISTGTIGVVGSASRGPLNTPVLLGSYSEAVDAFGAYDKWQTDGTTPPLSLTRTLEQLFQGGASTIYAVRVANAPQDTPVKTAKWTVKGASETALFDVVATSPGSWANAAQVTLKAASGNVPAQLELVLGRNKETYSAATAGELAKLIQADSRLVIASSPSTENAAGAPLTVVNSTQGGPDGAAITATEVEAGLAKLASLTVNIVVVAGKHSGDVGAAVLAHLEQTENEGRERIAVLGAASETANADAGVSNPRVVVVAPGIVADDSARVGAADKRVNLPTPFAAAVIAGKLSTLAPHISLTNKDIPVAGLTREYTRAEQKARLQARVLTLHKNLGFRVLKGITTDDAAFRQISVRRIVDYAKTGVRAGANPYIGRLNNSRVRAALKATLDGFLSGMILDEMLIGYTLDVSATRAQEISGQAIVTMTLQPTFSIDFVKVIINLE